MIVRNIKYAKPERCVLDVYSAGERAPVIVMIHGGAWFLGDKSLSVEVAQRLVEKGFTVVAPSYRLSNFSNENIKTLTFFQSILLLIFAFLAQGDERAVLIILVLFCTLMIMSYTLSKPRRIVHHPIHANDVARAVAWAHANVAEFGGSPDRIFLMGHSAGAHLASIVSCNPRYLRRVGLSPSVVKGTICLCGVFSDTRIKQSRLGREILKNAFGVKKSYTDAFPIYHVQPDAPPHLLQNASMDYSLKRHTQDFFFALRAQGVYVKSAVYPDTNHFNVRHKWENENRAVLDDIGQFVYEVLEKEKFGRETWTKCSTSRSRESSSRSSRSSWSSSSTHSCTPVKRPTTHSFSKSAKALSSPARRPQTPKQT